LNFLRRKLNVVGPCRYFDFGFCFFFIKIPAFDRKIEVEPSGRKTGFAVRIISIRQMLPFLLNLNLKPLYSSLGGSTTRTEPLTNPPTEVEFR